MMRATADATRTVLGTIEQRLKAEDALALMRRYVGQPAPTDAGRDGTRGRIGFDHRRAGAHERDHKKARRGCLRPGQGDLGPPA